MACEINLLFKCKNCYWVCEIRPLTGLKKKGIQACPLGKQLSQFACPGHFSLALVNDKYYQLPSMDKNIFLPEIDSLMG